MAKRRPKQQMSMSDSMDLVDDDMPDGAYWAMVHEMAGLDYGEGFDELVDEPISKIGPSRKRRLPKDG